MRDIYNYLPEINHVSRVYSVAAVLYLRFSLYVMLFRPRSMLCTFKLALSVVCACVCVCVCAVPNVTVFLVYYYYYCYYYLL